MQDQAATVWVFHGDGAQHASGVFTSKERALAWIEHHGLTGLLTEYPLDVGAFDDALARGLFSPSQQHHGTPKHIAQFSPGRTEHLHVSNGVVVG